MALRSRARRFRTAAAAIGFAATGCSSFGDGTTAGAGAAPVDAGQGPSADGSVNVGEEGGAPDGGAAGAKLLDEGFERVSTDCGKDWAAASGAGPVPISAKGAGHGSLQACHICQALAQPGVVTLKTPSVPATMGKRYVLEAFARRKDATRPPGGEVFLEQSPGNGPGPTSYNLASDAWTVVAVTREATETGTIRAVFTWDLPAAACVFIDDVVIREETLE